MVKADFVVGIFGNIISILSFASPTGTFREIIKTKSSDKYVGLPYVSTLLSTGLWTLYGLLDPAEGILILTVNGVGVVSQIIYLSIFLIFASKARRMKYLGFVVLDLIFVGMVIVITFFALHGDTRRTFVGVLCATFTTVMYAAPLSVVRTVIQTKSVEYMPYFLSLTLYINSIVWFAFAVLAMDFYVLVPNAIGIVLGSLQQIVYFIYKYKTPSSKSALEMTAADEVSSSSSKITSTKVQDLEEGNHPKTAED